MKAASRSAAVCTNVLLKSRSRYVTTTFDATAFVELEFEVAISVSM